MTPMSTITKEQYLADPCAVASIPYWKAKSIAVPEGMLILHGAEFDAEKYAEYADENNSCNRYCYYPPSPDRDNEAQMIDELV